MSPKPIVAAVQFALLAQQTGKAHQKCYAFLSPRDGFVIVSAD